MTFYGVAPKHAPFIFHVFEEFKKLKAKLPPREKSFTVRDELVTSANRTAIGSDKEGGVYLIYLQKDGKKYPVYIGFTSRTFRGRLREHASTPAGVIDCLLSEAQPKRFEIRTISVSLDYIAAKMLESIFLQAFDFPLNKSENLKGRKWENDIPCDQVSAEVTERDVFRDIYLGATQDVNRLLRIFN